MSAPPAGPHERLIARDVSASAKEFDASLRLAAGSDLSGAFPNYYVQRGPVRLRIEVAAGPERRIALVRLPTLRVTYRLDGGTPTQQDALLAALDRAMHRGGG